MICSVACCDGGKRVSRRRTNESKQSSSVRQDGCPNAELWYFVFADVSINDARKYAQAKR